MSASMFQTPRLQVPQTKPPQIPDLADTLLQQMQMFRPMRSERRESFLGEPPGQRQQKPRTILGGG